MTASTNVIISAIAAFLYVVVLISIPFRIRKNAKGQKNQEESEEKKDKMFWLREITIFVMSAVIIGLCALLSFGTVGNIVLCGCGVLGAYSASKVL